MVTFANKYYSVKYRYLFFDLDRTLWDYDANSRQALNVLFSTYELEHHFSSPDEFYRLYDHHNTLLWEDYRQGRIMKDDLRTKRFNITFEEKGLKDTALAKRVGDHYLELTPSMRMLFPGTIETLEYLVHAGYRLFILTNGFLTTQQTKMKNSGIEGYFERIFSSEEIGINKPHKAIYHWAVSSLNAPKSECLMIGDDLNVDIQGALDYGIDGVLFDPHKTESPSGRFKTIRHLAELQHFL
jgi:putative hydrolase of the HAD superfamily